MGEEKKKDLLDKGAIVQRDYETYAIAPHIAGGICEPSTLRRIADVAEKYNAKALKLTSAQRIKLAFPGVSIAVRNHFKKEVV
ncbi:hypothetical protein ES705_18957 [subsurface metagenome]